MLDALLVISMPSLSEELSGRLSIELSGDPLGGFSGEFAAYFCEKYNVEVFYSDQVILR